MHCARGVGLCERANTDGGDPDVVLACAGDVPTLEVLAAAWMLRERLLRFAFVWGTLSTGCACSPNPSTLTGCQTVGTMHCFPPTER